MPYTEEIAGVRVCDKSRGEYQQFRIEIWLKFSGADRDPKGEAIKSFFIEQYLRKNNILPDNIAEVFKAENHKH
jgi:hypothetical protein